MTAYLKYFFEKNLFNITPAMFGARVVRAIKVEGVRDPPRPPLPFLFRGRQQRGGGTTKHIYTHPKKKKGPGGGVICAAGSGKAAIF